MSVSAKPQSGTRVRLQGVGVSPGVVVAPAYRMLGLSEYVPEYSIGEEERHAELRRLEHAVIETRRQIKNIRADLQSQTVIAEAGILDAHLMVLDDHAYIGEIVNGIRDERLNAEFLVKRVTDQYVEVFSALNDGYFSERVIDIKDVAHRLIRNLVGDDVSAIHHQTHALVAVAEDLTPSEAALFKRDVVRGIATDFGSATSHTALLAKALRIPAVVGLQTASQIVQTGMELLIDGTRGVAILNPTSEDRASFSRFEDGRMSIMLGLKTVHDKPAETTDSHRIVLSANIESVDEISSVFDYGAEGVGLFRSEYLYIASERPQTEEEQTRIYAAAATRLGDSPFIVRTFDLGGDKYAEGMPMHREANPFLGCRSIRISLLQPEMFKVQLRAILRASAFGNVKIMYPMISGVQEVLAANEILAQAMSDLRKEGAPFNEQIEVGAMIEIPSAALTADIIAPHVDFFSIGTNDLTQYTLAVDRNNERVTYLYQSTHPGVLRLIQQAIDAGHRHNIWVGLCGEMAGNPVLTPLLVGMGVDELSVSPSAVPMIKQSVRSVSLAQAQAVAQAASGCTSPEAVTTICQELVAKVAPALLKLV